MLVARSGVAVSWIAATRKVAARITRSGSVDLVNLDQLPVRSDGSLRPAGLTLPPARMPLIHDRRPLKRWTYVGIYGEELMLCAASVRVGGIPQCFWAVLDRASGEMIEQTAFSSRIVAVDDGHLSVSSRKAKIELALRPCGEPVEVVSRHGASYIWTRKLPVVASGTVIAGGREQRIECTGLIDATAGYHARETSWSWSAGVGTGADGSALVWNIVNGVHDAPTSSERTVWVDGAASELPAAEFPADLGSVVFPGHGESLSFSAEAERANSEDLKIFASDYRQPFGTFSGALPGGVELASGFGVMERHSARW